MSLIIRLRLWYLGNSILPSFKLTGFINAPWVDGLDTKSQHTNSKSSWTSKVPSFVCFTEPVPLEEIPMVNPCCKIDLTILPHGVSLRQ